MAVVAVRVGVEMRVIVSKATQVAIGVVAIFVVSVERILR